ncbi:SRPBCC domain-containing protein [Actinomadura scrupuli]|uniref:SRPBCC family protein n=1 Tax=Actinomadura scrupuli TaxID=559629 RepID=UPI003D986BAE
MELDHEFTVPVPVDRAWPVLLDLERVAPCVPGATLDSVDGDEFTGRLKVKLGAMTITYKGNAHLVVTDESARIVTIEGSAKEARGTGTAAATVQAQLHAEGDATRVTVHTKLNITGRPAQFGRGILAEVGGKLISRFAKALSEELQVSDEERRAPAAPQAATDTPAPAGKPRAAAEKPATTGEPQPAAEKAAATGAPEQAAAPASAGEPQPASAGAPAPETAIPAAAPEPAVEAAGAAGSPVESPAGSPAGRQDVPSAPPTIPDGFSVAEQLPSQEPAQAAPATGAGTEAAPEPATPAAAPAAATSPGAGDRQSPVAPRPVRQTEEAIDLLEVAGPSVVKRAAPVFGGIVALLTVRYLFRRRRGRHHR